MKLQLVMAPNDVLTSRTKNITSFDKRLKDIVASMERVLLSCKDPEGVGLAAPQVGLPLSIFLMKPSPDSPISVFINPTITIDEKHHAAPSDDSDLLEGCLSVYNVWSNIDRSPTARITYQTPTGDTKEKTMNGFEAHIVQHEVDHLNGILFTQRALEQHRILYKMIRKHGKEHFEEIELL